MEIKMLDPNTLVPHPKNPRTGHAVDKIVASMQNFGFTNPILTQKGTNVIIAGHGRVEAAKKAGLKEVPVIELALTDTQAKAYMLTDNKLTDESEWEKDLLKNVLSELKAENFDLNLTGFSSDELLNFNIGTEEEAVDVPELPQEARCEKGKIYALGRHRIMCGDSTNGGDVALLMDGKKADMVFTDPPYGVDYGKKNEFLNAISRGNRIQTDIENDVWTEDETCAFWLKAFENIRDVLAEVNSYYIFGPQIQGMMMMMMMMMMKAKLPYKHVIIWVKNNHVLGRCDYNYRHEPIFFGWTKTHKFQRAGKFLTSVWEVNKPLKNDLHPTMKPIELIMNALLNSTDEGQICLDPFLGSGSTLIACEQTGRIGYGMEIDPKYCDVIIQRYCNFTGVNAEEIFSGGK